MSDETQGEVDNEALEAEARSMVEQANRQIADRCKELGIPEEFAPSCTFWWNGRGHNAVAARRAELRRAAKSKIDALEKEAITKIERMSLDAQTEVIASGLTSDAAKTFLNTMPSMDSLMPPIEIGEMQALIDKRHAEGRRELGHYDA